METDKHIQENSHVYTHRNIYKNMCLHRNTSIFVKGRLIEGDIYNKNIH